MYRCIACDCMAWRWRADLVTTLSAIRKGIMDDSGASFDAVTEAMRRALPGEGSTPERFRRLVGEIGEREAWKRVYVAAWADVDPRVERQGSCQTGPN